MVNFISEIRKVKELASLESKHFNNISFFHSYLSKSKMPSDYSQCVAISNMISQIFCRVRPLRKGLGLKQKQKPMP